MRRTVRWIAGATLAVAVSAWVAGGAFGRPSADDLRDAWVSQVEDEHGDMEGAEEFASCLVERSYDDLSAETLRAIVDGDSREPSTRERIVLAAAASACLKAPLSGQ